MRYAASHIRGSSGHAYSDRRGSRATSSLIKRETSPVVSPPPANILEGTRSRFQSAMGSEQEIDTRWRQDVRSLHGYAASGAANWQPRSQRSPGRSIHMRTVPASSSCIASSEMSFSLLSREPTSFNLPLISLRPLSSLSPRYREAFTLTAFSICARNRSAQSHFWTYPAAPALRASIATSSFPMGA